VSGGLRATGGRSWVSDVLRTPDAGRPLDGAWVTNPGRRGDLEDRVQAVRDAGA